VVLVAEQCLSTTLALLSTPRATLCIFSHAKIETTGSKGVHCSVRINKSFIFKSHSLLIKRNLLEYSTKIEELGSLNNYQLIK